MKDDNLKCNIGEYAVVVNMKKEFLILQLPYSKEFTKEAWMLPGGRLNKDDKPEQGLKREIEEEVGLKVKVISPVHTARWGNEKPQKYSVFFLCKIIGKQAVSLSHEHIDYKWIDYKDIEKIPWHNQNSKIAIKKSKILLERDF